MELHNWSDIRDRFRHNILLGNGASIAIDERLSYRSLYERVCESGRLNREIINMFEYFETTNFEFIMKLLLEASRVNEVLEIDDDKTNDYYCEIRDSLIDTIRDIHPTHESVEHLLPQIACFLMNFTTVLSLNYDLLVYWSMLEGNDKLECQWFKDCYVEGEFQKDFNWLYKPQPPAKGATLVFYPHGSLFLVTDIDGNEEKLSRPKDEILLETILARWKDKDYIPLFVSEGDTAAKFHAITRSNYLNTVYDSVLRRITGSLVIYGWSASEQDEHIFDGIDHKYITDIAVSVHTGNPNWESYCERIADRIASTHNLKDVNLYFFDSQCEGCWIF
ncbi:DUF4917 family protein [Candidatus Bathyarchaeota archaeon]|nr:DUF4917 family protein [Candidatus Bathyarchaeota archaeon]